MHSALKYLLYRYFGGRLFIFRLPQKYQSCLFEFYIDIMRRERVVLLCLPPHFILFVTIYSIALSSCCFLLIHI